MRQNWPWGLATALFLSVSSTYAASDWSQDVGKVAPPLSASGWVGTPVSLEAVKGNTVILAFWNADVPC